MHDSSAKFARLHLEPHPSCRLAALLAAAHAVAAVCLWFSGLPVWACGAGTLAVLAEWYWAHRRAVPGRRPGAVARVSWDGGQWWIDSRGGGLAPALLCGDSYVHPQLVILNFRLTGRRRRSVVLLADSLPADELRRLRVVLRTQTRDPA